MKPLIEKYDGNDYSNNDSVINFCDIRTFSGFGNSLVKIPGLNLYSPHAPIPAGF